MIIYESTETNFDSLGLGTITPESCMVTEELNGQYSFTLTHPIDEDGKWEKIQQNRIVKVQTHDGDQLFRLYRPMKNSQNGTITVYAMHIFYDLLDNLIEDTRPTAKDGQDAGDAILAGCQYSTPFSFSSDIEDSTTAYYIRKNPVEALIGTEDQSFINRWGGEIRRNNFDIEINQQRGNDLGMKIAYRNNLTGVQISSDVTNVVTRIMPTALNENGVIFYTDDKYYDSPYVSDYPHPKIGILNTNIRVGQEVDGSIPYATEAAAKTAMASMAQAAFDAGKDMPEVSLSVSYVNLGDTEEYAAYKDIITTAHIGDEVTLIHPELNIDVKLRIVTIEWDAAYNHVNSIVLGSQPPNYIKTAVSRDIDLSALKSNAPTNLQENGVYNGVYINHEDGFMTTAVIGGKTITTKQNSVDGFAIYDGETYIGGVKVINGEVALISNILTNDINGNCYATIGNADIDGLIYQGIFVYRKDYSTTDPMVRIVSYSNGGIAFGSNDHGQIQISPAGNFSFFDANGHARMTLGATSIQLFTDNSTIRIHAHSDETALISPSLNYMIGVDNSGAFKWNGSTGVKTYL